jgi:hypothetical protein
VDHLTLEQNGQQILVTAFRKQENPIPKPGDTLEGELGDNDRFDKDRRKFKRARPQGGGTMRRRDPAETRAIQRQHSQEMALRYISIKAMLHANDPELADVEGNRLERWDFDISDVWKLTDAFDRDLDPTPRATSDIPGDDGGLPPLNDLE